MVTDATDNVLVGKRALTHRQLREVVQAKITAIYRLKNPRKMGDVEGLMDEWSGEEAELLEQIQQKYRVADGDAWMEEEVGVEDDLSRFE